MIILPPSYPVSRQPVIFLAGPIQGAVDWQSEALRLLSTHPVDVANPRRSHFDLSYAHEQIDWETRWLREAGGSGCVLFWLAKEHQHSCDRAFAQTTRFELGEWFARSCLDGRRVVAGIEEGFTGAKYIKHRLTEPTHPTLEATVQAALRMALSHRPR